jgi:hypothetical protein
MHFAQASKSFPCILRKSMSVVGRALGVKELELELELELGARRTMT